MTTEAIWNIHAPSLYFFVLKRVQDALVAEDIVQNTFLKVHEHLPSLRDSSKARAWVFQIARNELSKHYKNTSEVFSEGESEKLETLTIKDEFCCFERFLDELPDDYQKVVKLVYLEGKTNAEAAEELNLSLANVRARIRRAKDNLKQRFQDCCNFAVNKSGKLVGSANCTVCNPI